MWFIDTVSMLFAVDWQSVVFADNVHRDLLLHQYIGHSH